jgi:hypothetical protein
MTRRWALVDCASSLLEQVSLVVLRVDARSSGSDLPEMMLKP